MSSHHVADIQGYTALMQQNEVKAIQSRAKHREIFNSVTEKYNGRILQYYGGHKVIFIASFFKYEQSNHLDSAHGRELSF